MSSHRPKEACMIVLDASMPYDEYSARFPKESRFSLGKKVADHYLRRFLQESRKTDEVGIVIVGESSDEENEIMMLQSAVVDHRKALCNVEPQSGDAYELTDAFELAAQKITERVKHYKFKRTICIITDGASVRYESALKHAKEAFLDNEMANVEIFLIDCDEESRPDYLKDGQKMLEEVFGRDSIKAVTPETTFRPHKRVVGQVKKWSGEMEVTSYCKFHVIMVARVAEERLKSLEKRSKLAMEHADTNDGEGAGERKLQAGGATVTMERKYFSSEDQIREVPPEERARGFRYGKDILPMFPADEEAMKLEDTNACLKVIGIINRSELLRNYLISSTNCLVANPDSANSQQGFSAFVRALRELDKVATCRYVRKDGTNPKFIALIPGYLPEGSEAAGSDCLWHIQLPTTEDIRDYPFESLEKHQPSETEEGVALAYVKAMTLVPGDAKETDRFNPEMTFNPVIARYWDAVHAKALEPDRPLPAASSFVTAMITADANVVKRASKPLRRFAKTFPLKRVAKKRDRITEIDVVGAEQQQQPSTERPAAATATAAGIAARITEDTGDDWFDDETKAIVDFVGTSSPVEDFWALLEQSATSPKDRTGEAFDGLKNVIRDFVGPQGEVVFHDKAFACLEAFREGALKYHTESLFNSFMRDLKQGLLIMNANDPFWSRIVKEKLTLISTKESHDVDVSTKDAEDFLSTSATPLTSQGTTQTSISQPRIFDEELFDEME